MGAGRDLVALRAVWMLTVLEVLIVVKVTILVVVSMLLRSELVHLLRASSKLIWAAITPHGHYLLSVKCMNWVEKETYFALGLAVEQK